MCGLGGMQVPDIAEAEEAFNDLGAPQSTEWTDGFYFDGAAAEGVTVSEDSNRSLAVRRHHLHERDAVSLRHDGIGLTGLASVAVCRFGEVERGEGMVGP